jgi:multiple sugar transport system permease protein
VTANAMLLRLRRSGVSGVLVWCMGMILTVLWLVPLLWMVSTSLKPESQVMHYPVEWLPRTISLENYSTVFEQPILVWTWNSMAVASITTFLVVIASSMTGYALARIHFVGQRFLFALILATRMIPGTIALVPLYLLIAQLKLLNTYVALIAPMIGGTLGVYLFRQFFLSLPKELEEAALIDGCGRFGLFLRIALPLAKPALATVAIITFVDSWNNFLWPLLVTSTDTATTLPIGIMKFAPHAGGAGLRRESYGVAMAAATFQSLPTLVVFLVMQGYFVQSVARSGLKG